MTITVGRVTLTDPNSISRIRRRSMEDVQGAQGLSYPVVHTRSTKEYSLRGREKGVGGDTNQGRTRADLLEREGGRWGSVYVTDTVNQIPEGYYELGDVEVENPMGRPYGRPWSFVLKQQPTPSVARQAEDDNVAGADTANYDAEEELMVQYTPTSSEIVVLRPRSVAGAEKINLPKGGWRIVARVYAVLTATVKLRARVTDLAGATLEEGIQISPTAVNGWQEVDLGVFTVAVANHKANWYELTVQDPTNTNNVYIDRVYLIPSVGETGGLIAGGIGMGSIAEPEVGL